jgi:hypothetical protein
MIIRKWRDKGVEKVKNFCLACERGAADRMRAATELM